MNTRVEYRDKPTIHKAADEFRNSIRLRGHNMPPIDVIYIAEIILKLNIIPIRNLFLEAGIDAALLPDLSGFYIDQDAYMAWEQGRAPLERRLRFSFAHEVGHYVLHRKEITGHRFRDVAAFKKWAGNPYSEASAEFQADEFAGRFLVPLDVLQCEYEAQCSKLSKGRPDWRETPGVRAHIAKKIAPRFGVSRPVIETRLDHEGIWPAE